MMRSEPWLWYAKLYRPHRMELLLVLAACLLQFALALPMVYLVARMFDATIPSRNAAALLRDGGWLIVASLSSAGMSLWVRPVSLRVTKRVIAELRRQLVERLLTLPRATYDHADTAVLHSQVVVDTERLDVMSNALISQMVPSTVVTIGLGGALAYLNGWLTLALLVAAPVLYFFHRRLGEPLRASFLEFRRDYDGFSGGVLFLLRSADLIRWQSAEDTERKLRVGQIQALQSSSGRMAWSESAHGLLQNQIVTLASVAVLVAGGYAVVRGQMSLGALIAYYVTMGLMRTTLASALSAVPQVIIGQRALDGVGRLLHSSQEPVYGPGRIIDFKGNLEFRAVDFSYAPALDPVLRDVSFTLSRGEIIAFAGSNGSGKSTILHLLCGFYRPSRGKILADQHAYDELDIHALRSHFGVVPQHPVLIDGTVADNIAYGLPAASRGVVERAARLCGADTFIEQLPDGYQTRIGDNGARLSGGQRQRVALARALVREPRLLILDEPTNHLDSQSVAVLVGNLRQLPTRPTVILISHDRSLIALADRAYQVQTGRVMTVATAEAPRG